MVCLLMLSIGTVAALDRVLLPESDYADKGGRCMDGTMSGYYYEPPPSGSSDLWVIYLKGGGACYDQSSCAERAKGPLGSSKSWSRTKTGSDLLSDDSGKNPYFYGAHKVEVPYCTGDTHGGSVVTPTAVQWGYYFSGHLNFEFIVEHIIQNIPAASSAKRILLTGNSAGGKGTMINCDFLQDKLVSLGSSAQVSCAPKAGWFFPGFTEDQEDAELPPSTFAQWSTGQTGGFPAAFANELYQSYIHPDCEKKHAGNEAYKCSSSSVLYPYIKTPIYVMENQYDTNQLSAQLGLPQSRYSEALGKGFIAYFGRAMRNSTQQIPAKAGDGLFLPSCLDHGISDNTKLKGFTDVQGLGDWFFGHSAMPAVLVDDCVMSDPGLPCNPSCDSVPSGDGCKAVVQDLCAESLSDVSSCENCARAHRTELIQGGCSSQKEVEIICEGSNGDVFL